MLVFVPNAEVENMSKTSQEPEKSYATAEEQPDFVQVPAKSKDLSRLERLKQKIKKLGGKDPDIYPMF